MINCQVYQSFTEASIPLTPWSKVPPSPSSCPSPPFPSPPSLPLPLEVAPLLRLGGLGKRFSSPSGCGRSPAAKWYLVNFRLKISPLVATIFRSFSGNETSNYDRHVGCLLNNSCTSPLRFCKNASHYFFHGAFAPLFLWSRRP